MMDTHHSYARRWRLLAVISLVVNVLVLGGALWLWHEEIDDLLQRPEPMETRPPAEEVPVERPDRMVLTPASHAELPGWSEDSFAATLPALERSCAVLRRQAPTRPVGRDGVGGAAGDWRRLCEEVVGAGRDSAVLRAVLERETRAWQVRNRQDETGLFTGYYEPSLRGRKRRGGEFQVPLHVRPKDLVTVDLGAFRQDLSGRRIAGRLRGDSLVPYHDREAIVAGDALAGKGLELVWVDDAVDAFFLQIQGSGRVLMESGRTMRVGYAGQNGHPYYAIGKELIEREHLTREEVSLQSIRRWLAENPDEAEEIMNTNASYVFFRQLEGEGPLGSQGVALTPERSLAVDARFLPLGAPVWLDTTHPAEAEGGREAPFRRLLVAQDTGGAIRGPVRGDVFWGYGDRAEWIAGHMKSEGRLWLLLPSAVEPPTEMGLPGEAEE